VTRASSGSLPRVAAMGAASSGSVRAGAARACEVDEGRQRRGPVREVEQVARAAAMGGARRAPLIQSWGRNI
jgi:hypothetical protein